MTKEEYTSIFSHTPEIITSPVSAEFMTERLRFYIDSYFLNLLKRMNVTIAETLDDKILTITAC